jgi:uncharacterized protein (TIGR01777 family)
MRIAVTGSTGLIGSALVGELRTAGHSVSRLVRNNRTESPTERLISWNPDRGVLDAAALEGHDAVVHLAGEPIFGRWTQARKARIRDSRVRGTSLLARTIAGLQRPPSVLVSASAIGFYGNRPASEPLEENSAKGTGFLANVVAAWEEASRPAKTAGTRVVNPRFGLVLSPKGGALAVMLPIFRAGLGGRLGRGDQMWSWITLNDVIGGLRHIIARSDLHGPVNFTTTNAVTNAAFTRTLGRILGRPTVFAAPAFGIKLVMGEMAEEMLLSGARVVPRKLVDSGYKYRQSELESALHDLLEIRDG